MSFEFGICVMCFYMIFLISNYRKTDAELIAKIADDIWDFLIGSKSVDFCGDGSPHESHV